MAKSKIIKELVNDEVSLTVALNRLYVLASDLGNQDILNWASKEISGYKKEDDLPDYRIFKSAEFFYTGINGGFQVNGLPLPLNWLSPDTIEKLSTNYIRESLAEIEDKAKSDKPLGVDRTYLATEVAENTYDDFIGVGVQCTSIQQRVASNRFSEILISIKHIALKLLLELDKKFGNLDDLDIGSEKISKKDKTTLFDTLNLIVTDKSVTKEKMVIKNSNVGENNTIDKETNVEISPSVEVNNGEKKSGFLSWIKGFFGGMK